MSRTPTTRSTTAIDVDAGISVRQADDVASVPDGWTVTETRWNGRDVVIAVDPTRVDVIRVGRPHGNDPTEALSAAGWRHAATDSTGASLWCRETGGRVVPLQRMAVQVPVAEPGPSVA